MLIRAALVLWLAALVGCAHPVERRDWSQYQGPGAEFFHQTELEPPPWVADPVEPMNRSLSAANHVMMLGAVDPLSWVYRHIIPRYFRTRINNFASNILYPRNLLANLFQGNFREARDETYRFGINTTVGFAGFFDPATYWGIESAEEDFGQAFATWGWQNSTFLSLPMFGPSTLRDGLGLIPDSLLNPATYFFPAGPALALNEMSDFVGFYKRFTSSNFDPYNLTREIWTVGREERIEHFEVEPEDTASVQTLQSVFLTFEDPNFPTKLRTRTVVTPATARRLPFSYRMQPEPAPILFLVPGLGAHRLGNTSLALAEMAWNDGFSVVSISSAMNFEFMGRGATAAVPGHAPVDSRDVHVALDAIYRDLDAEYPGRIQKRALMGYSLGAFHTLFIAAAAQDPNESLIDFDRYVTLDAPVNLLRGMEKLDRFFNAPLAYPADERDERVRAILHKTLALAEEAMADQRDTHHADEDFARMDVLDLGGRDFSPAGPLPFDNIEAEFLIGLSFRMLLQNIIFASQEREDLGVLLTERSWFRRTSAYEEIADYSYTEYMYAFVLPFYRDDLRVVSTSEELNALNDLRSIEGKLRGNRRIRHFANTNDFLTSDADVAWLNDVLGETNVRFFERGGHLGGLHKPEVQAEFMAALSDLVGP